MVPNSFILTLSILIIPVIIILIMLYILARMKKSEKQSKKYIFFVMGFISITLAYVFYPEPIVSQSLFIETGDFLTPIGYTAVASAFLFLAIYVFKKHMDS